MNLLAVTVFQKIMVQKTQSWEGSYMTWLVCIICTSNIVMQSFYLNEVVIHSRWLILLLYFPFESDHL